MQQMNTQNVKVLPYPHMKKEFELPSVIRCDWQALRGQLLLQWKRLTARDLDNVGPNRRKIAVLIQSRYGIAAELVENYLSNFERTMPFATARA